MRNPIGHHRGVGAVVGRYDAIAHGQLKRGGSAVGADGNLIASGAGLADKRQPLDRHRAAEQTQGVTDGRIANQDWLVARRVLNRQATGPQIGQDDILSNKIDRVVGDLNRVIGGVAPGAVSIHGVFERGVIPRASAIDGHGRRPDVGRGDDCARVYQRGQKNTSFHHFKLS